MRSLPFEANIRPAEGGRRYLGNRSLGYVQEASDLDAAVSGPDRTLDDDSAYSGSSAAVSSHPKEIQFDRRIDFSEGRENQVAEVWPNGVALRPSSIGRNTAIRTRVLLDQEQ